MYSKKEGRANHHNIVIINTTTICGVLTIPGGPQFPREPVATSNKDLTFPIGTHSWKRKLFTAWVDTTASDIYPLDRPLCIASNLYGGLTESSRQSIYKTSDEKPQVTLPNRDDLSGGNFIIAAW